jgi:hypothetical protein
LRNTRPRSAPTRRRCALNARPRVVVYVTREHPQTGWDELLVFDLLNEPEFAAVVPGGRVERGYTTSPADQENHAFHPVADDGTPEEWEHHVTGSGIDSAFVFRCRWVSLDDCPPLWGKPDPLVERLRASITEA